MKSEKPEKVDKKLISAALMEKGAPILQSLKEVTSWEVYSGVLKTKETDSRVNKGLDLVGKLQFHQGLEVSEFWFGLTDQVNRVSHMTDVLQGASTTGKDLVEWISKRRECILEMLDEWKPQQITGFLTDIGKKLCDDLIASEGVEQTFYMFLSTSKLRQWEGLSLQVMKDKADNRGYQGFDLLGQIATTQQNLVNYFLDRFRNMSPSSVNGLVRSIPEEWFLPEICRTADCCFDRVKGWESRASQCSILFFPCQVR